MSKIDEILKDLEENSNASTVKRYDKNNEPKPYFGVTMGSIGKLAKKYKSDSNLFMELFRTNNLDAQVLATYIGKPNDLTRDEINECINEDISVIVLDKFTDKILINRKDVMDIKEDIFKSKNPKIRRFGWNLEVSLIHDKKYDNKEIEKILEDIEKNLGDAQEFEKWSMNHAFVEIALSYDEYLDRVLKSSKKIGAYEDMKVSKGCTSAFAPSWIAAVLKKK